MREREREGKQGTTAVRGGRSNNNADDKGNHNANRKGNHNGNQNENDKGNHNVRQSKPWLEPMAMRVAGSEIAIYHAELCQGPLWCVCIYRNMF